MDGQISQQIGIKIARVNAFPITKLSILFNFMPFLSVTSSRGLVF